MAEDRAAAFQLSRGEEGKSGSHMVEGSIIKDEGEAAG